MTLLPRPREDLGEVVADVPTELHVRRADMIEAPVLERALGHLDDGGDLRLRLESPAVRCRKCRCPCTTGAPACSVDTRTSCHESVVIGKPTRRIDVREGYWSRFWSRTRSDGWKGL